MLHLHEYDAPCPFNYFNCTKKDHIYFSVIHHHTFKGHYMMLMLVQSWCSFCHHVGTKMVALEWPPVAWWSYQVSCKCDIFFFFLSLSCSGTISIVVWRSDWVTLSAVLDSIWIYWPLSHTTHNDNYSTIANFHTRAHTTSFPGCRVFISSCLVTAPMMAFLCFHAQVLAEWQLLPTVYS
jgi:hypothetical protein